MMIDMIDMTDTNMDEKEVEKKLKENEMLVYYVLQKYFKAYANDEDYKQMGMIGLWKAIITYDDSKSVKFSTYASIVILNYIRNEYRHSDEFKRIKNSVILNSIDDVIATDIDGSDLILADVIKASELDLNDLLLTDLDKVLKNLSDEEMNMLKLNLLELNQKQIAKILNCSQCNVSRINKKLQRKLTNLLKEE